MFDIVKYFNSQQKYDKIINQILNSKNTYIYNSANTIQKLLTFKLFSQTNKTIVVVYPNIFEASKAYEDYLELTEADQISFFPVEELVASELIASSNTYRLERIKTIFKIINNIPQIIVTSVEGITRNVLNKEKLKKSILKIKKQDIYNRDTLLKDLIIRGYQKVTIVENPGTYSVRGSVVDIYPINIDNPVRIEFFDNEIDNIKVFNVTTQRSIEKLNEVHIYPFYDIVYNDEEIPAIKERILNTQLYNDKTIGVINNIEQHYQLDQLYLYLPYIDPTYQTFTDLIDDKIIVVSNYLKAKDKEEINYNELYEYISSTKFVPNMEFFKTLKQILAISDKNLFFESFGVENNELDYDVSIDLQTSNNVEFNNYLSSMIKEFKLNTNKTYIVTHYDDTKLKLIKDLLDSEQIKYNLNDSVGHNKINLVTSNNALGYVDYELNIEIITPKQFAANKIYKKSKYTQEQNKTIQIYNKEELSIGDYVVHQDYGIGQYKGIKTIDNKKSKNDYLMIEYAEDGKLYVPVEKVYVLQKYLGSFDKVPKLTKLNTKEWEKKKAKVKEKLIAIAKDLIRTQAKRESLKGYIYKKDSEEQLMFENDFDYIETVDQIKAVEDVKRDMESERPVDRLICGDVGFGKTEVAMRAAFKAVDNGKQVAVLAPTTVLTRQHYHSFKERFEKYGMRVELLNRFVEAKDVKKVLDGLERGYVDIVIGTHRLLSNDIYFKNLGMLIIDEEQRFGVLHKEKIKQLKANVDVLSLSATPIPRTLQMSLSGLKEMSLIETPPVNRKSIQTYVLKTNESVIREAIYREKARGGQTFYLLNRIDKLDILAAKIKRLIPRTKVAIIHGRMEKENIEEVLNDFLDKKYDVLVCTTIVETGMDIPNANTLIIEQADHLGLSQLYQIRGRVGRSEQVAYAYLMYDSDTRLTDVAEKRLNAIKEFTALGSGYKIAMRDLSIRGAGDILGSEQSGFINDIGIELYMQMLEETLDEEKGITKEKEIEQQFNLNISKTVDSSYVDDDTIKIDIHQSINKVYTKEQAENLTMEFSDRYGKITNELKVYIYSKYLETLLKQKGIEKYKVSDNKVELNFDQEHTKNIQYIYFLQTAKSIAPRWVYEYKQNKIHITININEDNKMYSDNSYIYQLINFMEKM